MDKGHFEAVNGHLRSVFLGENSSSERKVAVEYDSKHDLGKHFFLTITP